MPISTKMMASTVMKRSPWSDRSCVSLFLGGFGRPVAGTGGALPHLDPLVLGVTARSGGTHPAIGVVELLEIRQVIVGEHVGHRPVRAHQQLLFGEDGVLAVGGRELEQLGHGDRLGGARFDAQPAEYAPEHVDLVDEPVPLAGRDRVLGIVVLAPDVDATGRARAGTQLTPDALLHAVGVAIEDVSPMETLGLGPELLRVLRGQHPTTGDGPDHLRPRDLESLPQLSYQTHINSRVLRTGGSRWPRSRGSTRSMLRGSAASSPRT